MILNGRLKKLQQEIKDQKLDAVLISKVANIIYLTNYSGFSNEEREAFLLITPKLQFLLTDGRYLEAVRKLIPDFELLEIGSKNKFSDLLKSQVQELKIKDLGVEEGDLTVAEFKQIKKSCKSLNDFKFHSHRSLKTSEEIKLIHSACEVGDDVFKLILGKIKAGISEKELAYYLENFIREKGLEPSFKTIAAFGKNAAIPHHQTGDAKLKKGDFVLLDFGVKFKNYCSDMTRTLVFGKASPKQRDIYQVVKEAQEKVVNYLQRAIKNPTPGVGGAKARELDKIARDYIIEKGYPSIPHSLGHGIGIEVHEHPYVSFRSDEIVKPGMIFSIEPGIYIPGFGGVRIEDLFVMVEQGVKQLTTSSKEFIEI